MNDSLSPLEIARAMVDLGAAKAAHGVPDLLIEVLSPLRPQYDTQKKRGRYAVSGVPWYWIVDPQASRITELQLSSGDYATVSEISGNEEWRPQLFPELGVDLSRLWK